MLHKIIRWWPHECALLQGLSHSGGFAPHATGGYKTVLPHLQANSSKPVKWE